MTNLRTEKENRRRAEIKKIEEKKNAAIKELTDKHEKKYNEIKNYYTEITNTNIDIIKQLKDDLNRDKKEEAKKNKLKYEAQEANNKVVGPMKEAEQAVKQLELQKLDHDEITKSRDAFTLEILDLEKSNKEIEYQYEVRLQQFQYLEKEKQDLYDEFHRLVYEIHQKTGLRNLILEKKHETI